MTDVGSAQDMSRPSAMSAVIHALFEPRPVVLLLIVSLAIGTLYTLTMLPLSLILGFGQFWQSPGGIISGVPDAGLDAAEHFVGYLYFTRGPWTFPILFAPNLGAPAGTNIFWVDSLPGISLLGKAVYSVTGYPVNLFGLYSFACLAMPSVAMTTLLVAAGQRNLVAAIVGSMIGAATPWLIFHWGHLPVLGHFWVILGLAQYVATRRSPANWRNSALWVGLLCAVFIINLYLFVMVSVCWGGALLQRRLDGKIRTVSLLTEACITIGIIACIGLIEGVLSPALAAVTTSDFGDYSMNLASPFVPQMSGLIPPLSHYRIGMNMQYEGFAYLGMGVLLIIAFSARGWVAWVRENARSHIVLICIFICFLLLALSNKVYLGSHLMLSVPLPKSVTLALGSFRSSGRFFWPVGYSIAAGSIVLVLRQYRPLISLIVLTLAAILQLVDVEPIRAEVAENASHPAASVLDRQQAEAAAHRSSAMMVFPSFDCVDPAVADGSVPRADRWLLRRANMDLQLVAARADLPINSVYSGRESTELQEKCRAEDAAMRQKLRAGTLYAYLVPFTPATAQLGEHTLDEVCSLASWPRYCLIPSVTSYR